MLSGIAAVINLVLLHARDSGNGQNSIQCNTKSFKNQGACLFIMKKSKASQGNFTPLFDTETCLGRHLFYRNLLFLNNNTLGINRALAAQVEEVQAISDIVKLQVVVAIASLT